MKKHIILTGTSGAGKTTLINLLRKKSFAVIEEAATHIIHQQQKQGIPKPWENSSFITDVLKLQQVQKQKTENENIVFFDRSPICTYALCQFLNFPIPPQLLEEVKNMQQYKTYWEDVLFIQNLGFINNTDARKITYEQSLIFEKIHIEAYKNFGFKLKFIEPEAPEKRIEIILSNVLFFLL